MQKVAVILERLPVASPWATHRWDLLAILPDAGGEPRTLVDDGRILQRLFPGFELALHRDEAEGYYLNASSEAPSVFVSLRTDEGAAEPYPFQATLSYNEAARWMDGGERVERSAAYPELAAWLGEWVAANYRPEPKQRRKPRSFEGKGGLRERSDS
jgi:hypothetical protein